MQAAKRLEKLYYSMPGSSKEDQDDKPFDIKNVPRGALGKDGISGIRTRKEIEEEERKAEEEARRKEEEKQRKKEKEKVCCGC